LAAAISASAADPANGKLQLYVAQCHFAVGEFEQSAATLSKAFQLLPPEQWGLVIENFRQFYKRNDYVKQFEQLLSFTEQSGQQQLGAALQAYHYRYLGHPDAAAEQLQVALRSSAPPQLASELKSLIQSAATTAAPLPAPIAGN
jgi:tetratricopeptide (TPR) repeat protein